MSSPTNPLIDRCEALAAAGRHITAVGVTQLTPTRFEARVTLQDWARGDGLLAGDGGIIGVNTHERLPDVTWELEATVERVEDWIIDLAAVGEAQDWALFERPGDRRWLTKPNKWSRLAFGAKPAGKDGER